jgi:hypothetical protein
VNVKDHVDDVTGNDIVKFAADLHYNFVNIHPFGDVNGGSARLIKVSPVISEDHYQGLAMIQQNIIHHQPG